ncbi:MAG: dihydrodipicolinate synthase family protein [Bacillota bacterium]|nr:hypothetical protein [Clostridia bacterium]
MKKFDKVKRQEHELIRNRVAIADFTMGLIEITGPDARKMLDEMCVNDIGHLAPGKVMYTSILNEEAIMIDDVTVYCYGEEKFWMISAFPDNTLNWLENHKNGKKVRFENMSDRIALWTIQGPDSRRMLASYLRYDMTNMKYYTFMQNEAGGIPIILSRTGFTGELGFEIFADKSLIDRIVSDLLRVGKKFGVKVLETDVTLESIPTEKGLITIRDFGGANPLEVGLDWSIKWDKPFFVGKERLLEIKNKGVKRKLMGFVAKDDEIDIENESVVKIKGKTIGKVTTANYGYTVEKSIGYCMIDAKYSEIGQAITIVTNGDEVEATLCDRVFYDKERVRVNANIKAPFLPAQNTKDFLKGSKAKVFKGVYAAMATPFLRDESLDKEALTKLVEHLIEGGVDGILVGGSSGEYPMQSVEERKELFKAAVDAAQGRCKIAACCSTNTTAGTKELCAYAGEIGVDFALIMTPFDMPTSEAAMIAYYKEIAAYSKPGVIIYHYPDYTSVTLSVEAIVELAKERNIVGIKNVTDLSNTVAIINETKNEAFCEAFSILTGSDDVFLGAMACGADGFMGVGACIAPRLCRELYDSFMAGDLQKARICHHKLCKIMSVVFSGSFPGTLKAALEVQGLACGRPRKPLDPVDIVCKRQIRDVLVETGIL